MDWRVESSEESRGRAGRSLYVTLNEIAFVRTGLATSIIV